MTGDWGGRTFGELSPAEKRAAARKASAALAAELAANAGAISAVLDGELPGETGVEGGDQPELTDWQRWMLAALGKAPRGKATPDWLITKFPETFPGADDPDGKPVRSARSTLHTVGGHLADMGLVTRGREQVRAAGGRTQGASRSYQLTDEGRARL